MKNLKTLLLIFSFGAFYNANSQCSLVIDFTWSQTGDNINFTNTSTGMPASAIFSWTYNGQNSFMENPSFSVIGANYGDVACLLIYDSLFVCNDSVCMPIYQDTTGSGACNLAASFTYTAFGGDIYFTNTSTGVPSGASFDWWYATQSSSAEDPTFSSVIGNAQVCLTIYDSSWTCFDSVCVNVFIDSTADTILTIQPILDLEFKLYPNPVEDILNISIENAGNLELVQIYNSIGTLVLSQGVKNESEILVLDVSELPKGIYFIRVFDGENPERLSSKRFVKK